MFQLRSRTLLIRYIVDGSVMIGATGNYNSGTEEFDGIEYMRCTEKNNFFPDLSKVKRTDLIYICSPNNPTGAVASKEQLKELVDFARKNNSIIIFDAAYSEFIKEKDLPRSIFELKVPGSVLLRSVPCQSLPDLQVSGLAGQSFQKS